MGAGPGMRKAEEAELKLLLAEGLFWLSLRIDFGWIRLLCRRIPLDCGLCTQFTAATGSMSSSVLLLGRVLDWGPFGGVGSGSLWK